MTLSRFKGGRDWHLASFLRIQSICRQWVSRGRNVKWRKDNIMKDKFEIKDDFYLNGEKMKIISGSIHYFRIVPEYWRDRLEKLKAMGCNTVETYIPWNLHEKEKGVFDFSGRLDIAGFVKTAQELGLWVILRPSPYICAEWEFGGFPYWLLKEDGMRLRCMYGPYIAHVKSYYEKLFQVIAPLQVTEGGPVIMMQVENEYGSYGDDHGYMDYLKQLMIENGCSVPLVTSDGPSRELFDCGKAEGVFQTGNFGSRGEQFFGVIKKIIGDKPLMCMEFWVGWFDSWGGESHQNGDIEGHAKDLDYMLSHGNVNFYMFTGGTNFGFFNGSNYSDKLTPDITSYDYDAPLTEDGQITPKYEAFKKVISKYVSIPQVEFTTKITRKAYGRLEVKRSAGLFQNLGNLSKAHESVTPQLMEKLGQGYGYIMYESQLEPERDIWGIRLLGANDRANIFMDEKPLATLYDRELLEECSFEEKAFKGEKISILVENMGRVNYGPKLECQGKGIGGVLVNGHQHYYWKQYCLPMEDLSGLDFGKTPAQGTPGFYEFTFEAQEAGDTFLDFSGWGKGCAFLNGFHLGRFWEIGPQKRLYIPAPLIRKGENTILLFETEGKAPGAITLCDEPYVG